MTWLCKYCGGTERHDRRVCRLRAMNREPEFAAAHAERSRARLRAMHREPEFAAAHAERSRARLRAMHREPEFAAAHAERMRAMNRDPKFRAAHVAGIRRRHGGDPDAMLPPSARAAYDEFRAEGFSHSDALDLALDSQRMEAAE